MSVNEYESPFSNRYGTPAMRAVWSESSKRSLWRKAWLELLKVQYGYDLGSKANEELMLYTEQDLYKANVEEERTKHDLVAERDAFANLLPLHMAAHLHTAVTSSDIEDYADEKSLMYSLSLLKDQTLEVLNKLYHIADNTRNVVVMGETHLQYAEPTFLGYRFSWYFSGLLDCGLTFPPGNPVGVLFSKGMHGAVGSNANFHEFNERTRKSGLFSWSTPVFQTRVRNEELQIAHVLTQAAAILHKLAFDMRILHSQGTVLQGKSAGQVGSSAMPGKNNPILAEKVCGLCRLMPGYARSAWDWSANTLLERTLDDSSIRRVVLPEMFLCMSEILETTMQMLSSSWVPDHYRGQWVENWRSWLPSRVLAIRMKDNLMTLPRYVHQEIESALKTCATPEYFITTCLPPEDYPTTYIWPDGWLWLEDLREYLNKYLDSSKKVLERLHDQ
jgi:adenylosuccinate lyase